MMTSLKPQRSDKLVPARSDRFLSSTEVLLTSLKAHQDAIGVKLNPASKLEAELKAFQEVDALLQVARTKARDHLTPNRRTCDQEAQKFIQNARHVFRGKFGSRSSQDWLDIGFAGGSLAMPKKMEDRDFLVASIADFLKSRPELEHSSLGVTAANGRTIHERFHEMRTKILNHDSTMTELSRKRQALWAALRQRVTNVIAELRQLLKNDDPRWTAFGFDSPAERKRKNAEARAKAKAEVQATRIAELPQAKAA